MTAVDLAHLDMHGCSLLVNFHDPLGATSGAGISCSHGSLAGSTVKEGSADGLEQKRQLSAQPLAVMRRPGELAGLEWRFGDWAPTQTTPQIDERDQIADRAVVLEDLLKAPRLWLAVLEFQARHEEDK